MEKVNVLTGNKLIAEFDGWTYIPDAKYKNDLYEAGDRAGDWETTDIFVLNPSKEFLKQKKFGSFADEDYYDNEKPYDDYKWFLNYNEDWNLLIGVIDKIYSLDIYSVYVNTTSGQFENSININTRFIKSTYEAVIEFIKWYNNEKS